jgi:molybdate transport system substrate-binding protein
MLKVLPFVLFLFFFSCSSEAKKEILNVAVAANFQFAIKEIVENFEKEHSIKCNIIISSSGKLTAQINEGAPYDIFISADLKFPEYLFEKGLTYQDPIIYAQGKVVLWTLNDFQNISIETLNSQQVKHIAMANPETAPYGLATKEILTSLNLWDSLQPKLVFGESIAQTNQFIISEAADIGFTAKAVVLSSQLDKKGTWLEIDKSLHKPINQGIVGLKNGVSNQKIINDFISYIQSENVKNILLKFGYGIPVN